MKVEAKTHYGTTVTAFWNSKFSKHALPGATHEDMMDLHDQQADHHKEQLHNLHQQYMSSGTRAERGDIKKQINFHNNLANKHQKMARFFENTNPNRSSIPRSDHPTGDFRNIPKPVPFHAPKNTGQSTFPAGNAKTGDNTNTISHHAARLWHSLAPKVKNFFATKRPDSPISRSHLTGEPRLPMPASDISQGHKDQAVFHNQLAQKAQSVAKKATTPVAKAKALNVATQQTQLAATHKDLAKKTAKLPPVPGIKTTKKPAVAKPTVKLPKGVVFKPPSKLPANNPVAKSKPASPSTRKPTAKPPSTVKTVAKPTPAVKKPTTTVKKPVAVKKVATPKVKPIDPANV